MFQTRVHLNFVVSNFFTFVFFVLPTIFYYQKYKTITIPNQNYRQKKTDIKHERFI